MTDENEDLLLAARFSSNSTDNRDLEFIKNKLENGFGKTNLVRNAITVYRKYIEGKLIEKNFNNQLEKVIKKNLREVLEEKEINLNQNEEENNRSTKVKSKISTEKEEEVTNKLKEKLMSDSFL